MKPMTTLTTRWHELPPIPDQQGFAGAFAGVSQRALIVAGGTNFPLPIWERAKTWHDGIFVLDRPHGSWREAGRLHRPLGGGMSVSYRNPIGSCDEVICIGGDDGQRTYADVFALEYQPQTGHVGRRPLPSLPVSLTCGGAAIDGGVVYVVAGQTGIELATATAQAFALDLGAERKAWRELPALPGGPRAFIQQPVILESRGKRVLFVSGGRCIGDEVLGMNLRRDAWEYDLAQGSWRRRADPPLELMAGPAFAVGPHALMLGYGDGAAMREMHARGISQRDYPHEGFPCEALVYDAEADAWALAGKIPANHVTTRAVEWEGGIVVPTGEVRPRVRSPKVWRVDVLGAPSA